MNELRKQLEYESGAGVIYSLGRAVHFLKSQKFDPEKEFFEFMIPGKIVPGDIKTLLTLPYEVSITEQDGQPILRTGTKGNIGGDDNYKYRRDYSNYELHSHPIFLGEVPVITPSLQDALLSKFASENTTLALVHPKGLMIYQRPQVNPDTGALVEEKMDVRDVIMEYCEFRGIDAFWGKEEFTSYFDLSRQ
ncbi:hypothetical protein CMO94_03500 [Candidatus Woesearchaeota archaeon]|jgi:hypothetical protein|nr:hypothetical protein [Candidatus Woesearchaeota archaeon]|tara:strand:+ start:1004 stop:1579 length:576 start_codon:yes stop_codon:yes gene_type:complete